MEPVPITVVSDVICPWCLIGEKRLELALAERPELDVRITFAPFLLDPSTPAGGQDLRERLRQKYGGDPESMFLRVEAAARESGIPLDFAVVQRTPNTTGAHVLIDAAATRGTQQALVKALFDAYFLKGDDVGDPSVLAKLASAHGFDRDEAFALATDDQLRARIRAIATAQSQAGVSGVPFFIFDDHFAVSGAQPVDAFVKVLDAVIARRDEAR